MTLLSLPETLHTSQKLQEEVSLWVQLSKNHNSVRGTTDTQHKIELCLDTHQVKVVQKFLGLQVELRFWAAIEEVVVWEVKSSRYHRGEEGWESAEGSEDMEDPGRDQETRKEL